MFDRALALDPQSVNAQSELARHLAGRVMDNLTDTAAADMVRAQGLVERALAASPHSGVAHFAKGQVLRAQRRFAKAILEYEMTLATNRNSISALFALGTCKVYTGSIEETIPIMEQAIRISPLDPHIGLFYGQIGLVHLLQSRTDKAIVWLEKARNAVPAHPSIRARLASAYALRGDARRAAAELAEARRLGQDDRYTSVARLRAVGYPRLFETTYFSGLRLAGMPEE